MNNTYDIAIIGGGLAGLAQAILLGNCGHSVVCIDRETADIQTDKSYDIRTTAISWGSRNLLKNAGIWADIADRSQCISDILILDEDSPIELEHTKPHNGLALEHFRTQGPFAVLPYMGNASAVVWTVDTHEAKQWLECEDDVFNAALQTRCGDRFGDVAIKGTRAAWPLTLVKSHSYIGDRMVLVAEAAHGIHPIAGQGLNMSLRDIAALTDILDGATDVGDPSLLKKYQSTRRLDNIGMVAATDILNELFGNNVFAVRAARRFGLHAVSKIPFAKKFFMKQAMGAVGSLPDLIKGVS